MFLIKGLLILLVLAANGVFSARLNDEFSIGTNLNKYLDWPNKDDDNKRNGDDKRNNNQANALWFGPRLGKRSSYESDKLSDEMMDILEKIQKSPELQNILAERFVADSPLISYLLSAKHHESQLIAPRYLRESPADMNLNSRPYPPRFGRSLGELLPPYLPRLG